MTKRRRWNPLSSPLTRRILLVNLVAPVILAAGLLFLDRYKQGLVRSELAGLTTHAEMLAGAVGEGAVSEQALGFLEINQDLAQHMVRRLAQTARIRARLFDAVGGLAADSRFLLSAKGNIRIEDLAPPPSMGMLAQLEAWWDRAATWMPLDENLPVHLEPPSQKAEYFPEAVAALSGKAQGVVRTNPAGGIVLSVAVPVQRYKQVVGALMVSQDGSRVARALFQVRVAIAQVFVVALAVTIALSLYMAGTIARPIRRLALAAEQVRHGRGRAHRIPDLSSRGDEIGELSVALKEMTEALWARMDAIERFAADVAHEIKNPLTSVRSAVETATRLTDPEKQKKLLSIIQDDVERLNRLISDISDASRVDAEMSRADTDPVPLARLLETLAEVYRSTAEHLHFPLTLPEDDDLVVNGIEGRLVQVLRNLIGNAISFSPPGGTIHLTAERAGKTIRVTVEDNGPGIPDGKLDAIFDRFYTERPAGEKFGTHSGLGLSISKQIIDAHGGRIWAENRDEGGARFVVELPNAPSQRKE
ncbi:stimulus-sensing domain-containing protein [Magnetospirillum sp. 64-120]|uniref:stimulus-sensing domain-containing protein n=1 Tax=Magnetospirillum sp. 64-120 TaxID=1895778 RepID=UPI000A49D26F|nr:stimulus-sensing domain-containing protein [Magnetospirillum sp. 64-120]